MIFEEQSNMPYLIHKVMIHTQATLHCEQCHVLLLDEVSHVSDHLCVQVKCHVLLIVVVRATVEGRAMWNCYTDDACGASGVHCSSVV